MSRANAQRAGIDALTRFEARAISAVTRPEGLDSGLVVVNPPYGDRIGDPGALTGLYASFGRVMREQFSGWRVGMITDKPALAQATGLPKGPSAPIPHGRLKVRLYQTARAGLERGEWSPAGQPSGFVTAVWSCGRALRALWIEPALSGRSSTVERQPSKLYMPVRFRSPAPFGLVASAAPRLLRGYEVQNFLKSTR